MDKLNIFEERVIFRLFNSIQKMIVKIVNKAKTPEGLKKYDSESHFLRCAVMQLINKENKYLNERGRPLKK